MSNVNGLPTHHSRVETWECDFNNHWNTRFYIRCFQKASDVVGTRTPATNISDPRILHVRFYAELFVGDPVEVCSAYVTSGEHQGRIAHFLYSYGRVVTAALETAYNNDCGLPHIPEDVARPALPRGIEGPPKPHWRTTPDDIVTEHGIVRPAESDHRGALALDEITRMVGIASHEYLSQLGYTVEYTKKTNIGRMLAEMRLTVHADCPVGQRVVIASRLTARGRTSFVMSHAMLSPDGMLFAVADLCMLAADMRTRRGTQLPDFMLAAPLSVIGEE